MNEVTEKNISKIIQKEIQQLTEENRVTTVARLKDYLVRFYSTTSPKNFLFVYGTLRKGQYNYTKLKALFGDKSIESIYTTESTYADLYDLGNYPVMIESKGSYTVIGEVIYCNDEVIKAIKEMEEGVGYKSEAVFLWLKGFGEKKEWKIISMPCYVAGIELQEQVEKNPYKYPRIFSGDWYKYLKAVEIEDIRTPEQKMMEYYGYDYECY